MKRFVFSLILLFNFFESFSQGNYPVSMMTVVTNAVSNYVGIDGNVYFSDTTIFNNQIIVLLDDTSSILNLAVTLQKDVNDTVSFQKIFNFDVFGIFPDGTSFNRIGYEVTLDLGNYSGFISPKATLVLERIDGTFTDIIQYY